MPYQITCDIHTHTLFSRHAYSTIMENLAAARDAGLQVLGSADHFSDMLFTQQDIRNFQYFLNVDVWPRKKDGVVLLRGAEADIVSLDGHLFGMDIPCYHSIADTKGEPTANLFKRVTGGLDYIVASVHSRAFAKGATIEQATQMYLNVLAQPKVFVLGHVGRAGVPFNLDTVLTAARDFHKLIEINEHSLEVDRSGKITQSCRDIARRCAELGVGITVSTDAHISSDIGRFSQAPAMLEEIGFPQELIVNRSAESLLEHMALAGVCDLRALIN